MVDVSHPTLYCCHPASPTGCLCRPPACRRQSFCRRTPCSRTSIVTESPTVQACLLMQARPRADLRQALLLHSTSSVFLRSMLLLRWAWRKLQGLRSTGE